MTNNVQDLATIAYHELFGLRPDGMPLDADTTPDNEGISQVMCRAVDPETGAQVIVSHTAHGFEFRILNLDGSSYYAIPDAQGAADVYDALAGL